MGLPPSDSNQLSNQNVAPPSYANDNNTADKTQKEPTTTTEKISQNILQEPPSVQGREFEGSPTSPTAQLNTPIQNVAKQELNRLHPQRSVSPPSTPNPQEVNAARKRFYSDFTFRRNPEVSREEAQFFFAHGYRTIMNRNQEFKSAEAVEGFTRLLCKGLGHEWGLGGKVTSQVLPDLPIKLEGSYCHLEHARLHDSTERFFNMVEKRTSTSKGEAFITAHKQEILDSLHDSIVYSVNPLKEWPKIKEDLNQGKLVTVGLSFLDQEEGVGHTAEITMQRDLKGKLWVIYTDRGPTTQYKMQVLNISGDLSDEALQNLLGKSCQNLPLEEAMRHYEQNVIGKEPLNFVVQINRKEQKKEICGWANGKGGVYGAFILSSMKELQKNSAPLSDGLLVRTAIELARPVFKEWELLSRQTRLEHFVGSQTLLLQGSITIEANQYLDILGEVGNKLASESKRDDALKVRYYDDMKNNLQTSLRASRIPIMDSIQKLPKGGEAIGKSMLKRMIPGSFFFCQSESSARHIALYYKQPNGTIEKVIFELDLDNELIKTADGKKLYTLGDLLHYQPLLAVPVNFKKDIEATLIKATHPTYVSSMSQAGEMIQHFPLGRPIYIKDPTTLSTYLQLVKVAPDLVVRSKVAVDAFSMDLLPKEEIKLLSQGGLLFENLQQASQALGNKPYAVYPDGANFKIIYKDSKGNPQGPLLLEANQPIFRQVENILVMDNASAQVVNRNRRVFFLQIVNSRRYSLEERDAVAALNYSKFQYCIDKNGIVGLFRRKAGEITKILIPKGMDFLKLQSQMNALLSPSPLLERYGIFFDPSKTYATKESKQQYVIYLEDRVFKLMNKDSGEVVAIPLDANIAEFLEKRFGNAHNQEKAA